MDIKLSNQRVEKIIDFIDKLNLERKYKKKLISGDMKNLLCINEALTHSSAQSQINYEKLEFLGDAVLRLIASDFIKNKYPKMQVGERSKLRSELVSDKWLEQVGEQINIRNLLIIGPKTLRDQSAKGTIQAEATEALIGALYEILNILDPIRNWLIPFWEETSKEVLADPHRKNYKSALQEWSQSKGLSTPSYQTTERYKQHGHPKRFFCTIHIKDHLLAEGSGGAIKAAEKDAAKNALVLLESQRFTLQFMN